MIFDKTLQFSDAQAVVANAPSTNIIDLGANGTSYGHSAALLRDLGIGADVPLLAQIVEAFNNITSIDIALQGSVDEAFTSPVVIQNQTILLANAVVGRQLRLDDIERGASYRYMRMYYTIVGSAPTTGKITAGIVAAVQPDAPGPY
jgi:hypothetical protein